MGLTVKPADRLRQMNTNDPHRAYRFYHKEEVNDLKAAEAFIHRCLSGFHTGKGEWFRIAPTDVLAMFRLLKERRLLERLV